MIPVSPTAQAESLWQSLYYSLIDLLLFWLIVGYLARFSLYMPVAVTFLCEGAVAQAA